MVISDLQDRLRELVRERIAAGELTGTELANRAGFQQAHVSNFLNRRRGLSIEAMDRVMEILRLEVHDLMLDDHRKAHTWEGVDTGFDSIPLVGCDVLLQGELGSEDVVEYLRFKKSFLRRIRPELVEERKGWHRFVLMKTDKDSGAAMRPRLTAGATLLVDRHYNSLQCYRKREPNLYVVKDGESCVVRYVELQGTQLTLRPENQDCALGFVQLGRGEMFTDYVVGRVAHIAIET